MILLSRNGQIFDIKIIVMFSTSLGIYFHKLFIINRLNKFVFLKNLAWMLNFLVNSSHEQSTIRFSCAYCTWSQTIARALLFFCPRGLTLPGDSTGDPITDDVRLNYNEVIWTMICVVEYGENIGTLRNLFRDFQQAQIFVKQIIALSDDIYECIGPNQWYCQVKNEYVKIESS